MTGLSMNMLEIYGELSQLYCLEKLCMFWFKLLRHIQFLPSLTMKFTKAWKLTTHKAFRLRYLNIFYSRNMLHSYDYVLWKSNFLIILWSNFSNEDVDKVILFHGWIIQTRKQNVLVISSQVLSHHSSTMYICCLQ